jgi:hypothetical protein
MCMRDNNIYDIVDTSDIPYYHPQATSARMTLVEKVRIIVTDGVNFLGRPISSEEVAVAFARKFDSNQREVNAVLRMLPYLVKQGFISSTRDRKDRRRVVYTLNRDEADRRKRYVESRARHAEVHSRRTVAD